MTATVRLPLPGWGTFEPAPREAHLALGTVVVLLVLLERNRTLGADLAQQLDERLDQQAQERRAVGG